MLSAHTLLLQHRDTLLEWLRPHPAPLLRWLRDTEVLSSQQYLSLLERTLSNQVASVLELVCQQEESSWRFVQVLQEVQHYYCAELQAWLCCHCKGIQSKSATYTPSSTELVEADKQKKGFRKLFKLKSQKIYVSSQSKASFGSDLQVSCKHTSLRGPLIRHKRNLTTRTQRLVAYFERGEENSNSSSHIEIRYTDLFVTEDDEVFEATQHEYFTLASRRARIYTHQAYRRINACQVLEPGLGMQCQPKRVKVKGIAGIGKSVAVQRMLYEWSLGKAFREFTCVFDLSFRELNLIHEPCSLIEILGNKFPYLQGILPSLLASPGSLLFIMDGLDEFHVKLDWSCKNRDIGGDTKLPVSELVVALVKGSLLPSSTLILTSRPSTNAPKEYFQRCCVVLGFDEEHVRKYISKFYKNPEVANQVFSYIHGNDSLFALSFIPLYCYIICTALAEFFSRKDEHVRPQYLELNPPMTMSEVYFFYLLTAIKHHVLKGKTDENISKSEIFSVFKPQLICLGKLAYENLLKREILFDQQELERCGLEAKNLKSTFFSQILVQGENLQMFSFFHLTIQEHLAALYCIVNFSSSEAIINALDFWCFREIPSSPDSDALLRPNIQMENIQFEELQMYTRFFIGLVRAQIDGHLDGLVEDSYQLEDLMQKLCIWFQTQFRFKELQNQEVLNLFHCLLELHNENVTRKVALEIRRLNLFKMKLSTVDCSALYYVLKFVPHNLEELNLGYSNIGNHGLQRLGPVLHQCESLYLRYNSLGKQAAILESAVLKSKHCQVKKLFMCGNELGPEGIQEIWSALEQNSTVEELYVDITGINEQGTENIVHCLSRNGTLKSLTVVGNEIGDTGKLRLRHLRELRPDLRIIENFVDDMGLLQAYLDWVGEITSDKDQMESVKNVDALQSVLKGLSVPGSREATEKAKELERKILEVLESHNPRTAKK